MNIYIAGPFFNSNERAKLIKMIESIKIKHPKDNLFIPMEHFIENGNDLPNNVWSKKVFEMDIEALQKADFIYALNMGHVSDTGTAWEIGFAYAKKIPVILITPEGVNDISCMIANSVLLDSNINSLNHK